MFWKFLQLSGCLTHARWVDVSHNCVIKTETCLGSRDIVSGNSKLILGLIWLLIQRYQLAQSSRVSVKKLLMAWLQSVLPETRLTSFKQLNDGVALTSLIDYCNPGIFVNRQPLDPSHKYNRLIKHESQYVESRYQNCARALETAERRLGVPAILTPENLSSPDLDELSCMTYLSYFVKKNGPGYNALLKNVQAVSCGNFNCKAA